MKNIITKNKEDNTNNDDYSFFKSILISGILAITYTTFFGITIVSGSSMFPTLKNGDILFMERASVYFNNIKSGDIISFKQGLDKDDKQIFYIKRVIGVEGDTVEIKDGNVYINGEQLKEDYLEEETYTDSFREGDLKVTLEENEFFVLGDNRDNSNDSRFERVGVVTKSQITSKKVFKIMNIDFSDKG